MLRQVNSAHYIGGHRHITLHFDLLKVLRARERCLIRLPKSRGFAQSWRDYYRDSFYRTYYRDYRGTLQLLDFMVDSTVGRTQIPDETDPDSRSGGPNFPLEILQLSGDSWVRADLESCGKDEGFTGSSTGETVRATDSVLRISALTWHGHGEVGGRWFKIPESKF